MSSGFSLGVPFSSVNQNATKRSDFKNFGEEFLLLAPEDLIRFVRGSQSNKLREGGNRG